jgi:uncharacterized protein YaiI (UPF0178 family)
MNTVAQIPPVQLYVDADSCPKQLRTIILKAVITRKISSVFVADRSLNDVQRNAERRLYDDQGRALVTMLVVPPGDNSADDHLVALAHSGALAITHDIPLAFRLAQQGMVVLDDRGNTYTEGNVGERLSLRNHMTELREYGVFAEKTKPLGPRDIQAFANALDRALTRMGY